MKDDYKIKADRWKKEASLARKENLFSLYSEAQDRLSKRCYPIADLQVGTLQVSLHE